MSLKATRRRKRLSMTPLIDVIFLLLLFFMLSSTFSRFAEVEITAGGSAAASSTPPAKLLFLRLSADGMTLNGAAATPEAIKAQLSAAEGSALLISVTQDASAQALTDALVIARGIPDLPVTVLGGP